MTTPLERAGTADRLDPLVRRIFVGVACSALGSGLTLPFLYVYLSEVRGISTSVIGLLFAWMGLLGLLVSPLFGTLIDRHGPRRVIMLGLAMEALGVGLIGFIETTGHAVVVLGLVSAGTAAMWPATTALLTRLVPETQRERVYGLQFMLLNAGLGVGGLVSAALVHVDDAGSFQRLYLLDALTYVAFILVVASLPAGVGAAPEPSVPEEGGRPPGWGAVLRDRTMLRVSLVATLLVTFGYAQLEAGFAAYTVDVAGIPPRTLGLAFAANTGAIVLGQLYALRWIQGRRRSRMLGLTAAIWSVSWAVIALSALTGAWTAVVLVILGLALFGIGETLWAPVAPAVVNALATEELRGRYNAAFGATWTVSMIMGPAIAGLLIGNDLALVWVLLTVGGTALGSFLLAGLRRHLTDQQDGLLAG